MINTKAIVKVQFRTNFSQEKLQAVSSEDMPALAEVPGLISKIYYVNPETGYLGAIYHFENDVTADNYIRSGMITNLRSRYGAVSDSLNVEKVNVTFVLLGKNTEHSIQSA